METEELELIRMNLKSGCYDGIDIMQLWILIDELIELRKWSEKVFIAHPNIDLDIERGAA